MRARLPDSSGYITRDGVNVAYDVYGQGNSPAVVLLPTWAIAQTPHWKAQIPFLARRYRVVTIDGRGNGRSARPTEAAAYAFEEQAADAIAVMDATSTGRAVVAGVSNGGVLATLLAATYPDRVTGAFLVAPAIGSLGVVHEERMQYSFDAELDTDEGWAVFNQHAWRRDLAKFAAFFWGRIFTEPHSTKQREDGVGWTLETNADVLIASVRRSGSLLDDREKTLDMLRSISCPILVVHGTADEITPVRRSELLAEVTGADLLLLEGAGHCPQARDPIKVNLALAEFIERVTPAAERPARRTTWTRALARPKQVLYLSSPLGLGHARRDLAIVRALREECDGVQVDWLTQHPVTAFLGSAGERVHPASALLANESAHVTSEAHEHDLHVFQAIRRMDEILVANFTVMQDLVEDGDYDLVVGDEAWDLDYFWHENPELKRSAYAWMTDFVGWLPMPDGGAHEAMLTADYNAEMIEQVERFTRIRDRAIFVGEPEDIVPDDFGPGLPSIREWTERHYDFSGYITGFEAGAFDDRAALRKRLGYPRDTPVVVVTVGGAGVGESLLRKVIDSVPLMRKRIDDLQVILFAGPRIDPADLPIADGVDLRGYDPDVNLHLAASDGAIVQGGLTTTMELVSSGRPFLYFPLGHHFEQQRHVRHRLDRHRAGRCLDFTTTDGDDIAAALAEQLNSAVDYVPIPTGGATRAAQLLAELL